MTDIHPTAIVEDGARVGDDVSIGPYSCVGAEVELGDGVTVMAHVVIGGRTTVGPNCQFFPFASIGLRPQDLKYAGEPSELIIGANNIVREYVTMNPGTAGGDMVTRVGNNCLFMLGAHVAHDCVVNDHVVLVNNATLGGHVSVGDHAIIGGLSAVHQFARVGKHAMVGGMTGVENDVIPFGSVVGNRAHLSGLNIVGMKRSGFSREDIHSLRNAYRLLFAQEGTMQERIVDVAELFADTEVVMDIVEFMRADSSRSLCQPEIERAA